MALRLKAQQPGPQRNLPAQIDRGSCQFAQPGSPAPPRPPPPCKGGDGLLSRAGSAERAPRPASGKIVRRLSWRATTSASAASRAICVQITLQAQGNGNVIGRTRPLQPIKKPQPLLRIGERQPLGPRLRDQRQAAAPRPHAGELANSATVGASKRVRMASSTPRVGAHPAHQARGQ